LSAHRLPIYVPPPATTGSARWLLVLGSVLFSIIYLMLSSLWWSVPAPASSNLRRIPIAAYRDEAYDEVQLQVDGQALAANRWTAASTGRSGWATRRFPYATRATVSPEDSPRRSPWEADEHWLRATWTSESGVRQDRVLAVSDVIAALPREAGETAKIEFVLLDMWPRHEPVERLVWFALCWIFLVVLSGTVLLACDFASGSRPRTVALSLVGCLVFGPFWLLIRWAAAPRFRVRTVPPLGSAPQ
jgi:hypothetical protein